MPKALVQHLGVVVLGMAILAWFHATGFSKLVWPDETVYAVVGRNIAAGRGPISNFYVARSIREAGVPLGDVHMPGHAFTLGAAFWLLGTNESIAFIPNEISFVLTGVILFNLSRLLFGAAAGVVTALLFYLFPGTGAYAMTTMSELTLMPISALYLLTWCRSLGSCRPAFPVALAVLLGLGAIHHETFLALVPSALYALWLWPRGARRRGLLAFIVTLTLCLTLVVWPLRQTLAPHPHWLSTVLAEKDKVHAVGTMLLRNLRALVPFGGRADGMGAVQSAYNTELVAFLLALVVALRHPGPARRLALFSLFHFAATLGGVIAIYPLWDANGYRLFMACLPGALVALGFALTQLQPVQVRGVVVALGLGLLGWLAAATHLDFARGREEWLDYKVGYADALRQHLCGRRPSFVVAPGAFRYGWEDYPVNVILSSPYGPGPALQVSELAALQRAVPLDLIALPKREAPAMSLLVTQRAFSRPYRLDTREPRVAQNALFVDERFWCANLKRRKGR